MKKLLALVLSLLMVISIIPVGISAFADEAEISQIDACEGANNNWSGGQLDINDYYEGTGSIKATGASVNLVSGTYGIECATGIGSKGNIVLWLYVSDVDDLDSSSQFVITQDDAINFGWRLSRQKLSNGWNRISLSMALVSSMLTNLNSISLVASSKSGADITVGLDDICFSSVSGVTDDSALDEVIADAEQFSTSGLSDHREAQFERYLDYVSQGVKTQRDVELYSTELNNIMNDTTAKRETGVFTDVITTHGRAYYKEDGLHFGYSASGFSVRFYGTELKATMKATGTSTTLNVYVDKDIPTAEYDTTTGYNYQESLEKYNLNCTHFTLSPDEQEYTVVSGLEEGIHTVTLLKRGEVVYTSTGILTGLSTDGELLTPPEKSNRKIEIIGDSNVTGYGNLVLGGGGYSVDTQDGTLTFGAYAANELGAEYSIVARSGCTVTPNDEPDKCTEGYMYNTYLYTDYWNNGTEETYDFASNPSDVVIIHIGDNDHDGRAGDMGRDKDSFAVHMKNFIRQVRTVNPDSEIIVAFSLCGYSDWHALMKSIVDDINAEGDTKVYNYAFPHPNNSAPAGHPNMQAHKTAGHELAELIKEITGWQGQSKEIYSDPTMQSGSVTADAEYSESGKKITFSVTADQGFTVNEASISVVSNGEDIDFEKNEDGTYSFIMPENSVMLTAEFTEEVKYGKLTPGEKITVSDALKALQASVNKTTLTEEEKKAADVNGDGKVNINDALLILQYSVGKITKFPVEDKK